MNHVLHVTDGATLTAIARTKADRKKAGFTLLELSIVLTIIGLIIGGVLTGQTLIQQARLNKVMTDVQKFVTAFQTFQTKYNALPGDMANATKYWGAAGGNVADNYTFSCWGIQGTGTTTCNGNGDGVISYVYDGSKYWYGEQYRAWQQLSIAGFIEGSYNGLNAANPTVPTNVVDCVAGYNCPRGPWSNSVYEIYDFGNYAGAWNTQPYDGSKTMFPAVVLNHVLMFGAACPQGSSCWPTNPILTPSDALSMDQKYDDGMPFTGIIVQDVYNNCATSPLTSASTYNLSASGQACGIVYVTGF